MWLYDNPAAWVSGLPPWQWHGHEMLFGFVTAAIAGFMLTAVPSWTGSRGFGGWPLALLALTWLLGRITVALAGALPFIVPTLIELLFLPCLALLIAPKLLRTRNRNTVLLLVLLALWCADAAFMLAQHRGDPHLASTALRFALNVVLLLITVIGGRIVPAFTGNALRQRGCEVRMRSHPAIEWAVIASMLAMPFVDALLPGSPLAGLVAFVAALAHAWRLAGWNGHRTLGQPIVWVLHAAYVWLPLGLLLKAAWLLGGFQWAAFWMHALGAGAAGTMILAVMSRAALGHTGRPLQAAPAMTWSYLLLVFAAAVRVFGPHWLPLAYPGTILLSGVAWIAAFVIYAVVYTPILLRPRADGKPG